MSILPGQHFILFGQHIWQFREILNNILRMYHKHWTGYGNTPAGISYPHCVEKEREPQPKRGKPEGLVGGTGKNRGVR